MDKERILTPAVVFSVALLHLAIVALLWQAHKLPVIESGNVIEFVDLGDFGGGAAHPKAQARLPRPNRNPRPIRPNLSNRPSRF